MNGKKRTACIIPPYYRLIGSKNNRLAPAMHYVAEILYRSGHPVIFVNGDYAGDETSYADRLSLAKNNWLLDKEHFPYHNAFDEIMQTLKEFQPEAVVIGAGDILIPTVEFGSIHICAYLCRRIKEELGQDVHCIGYGHQLKYISEEESACFDACVACEAETIIDNMIDGSISGSFDGIWTQNLDSLPILTDEYIQNELMPYDWDYIMSMRGCPCSCKFCYQPGLRNHQVSYMSPERFIKEIKYRIHEKGTKRFYFSDPIFLPNQGTRTDEMLALLYDLKQEIPDFNWWAEMRVDLLTKKEQFDALARAGCQHLKFGVEAGNQRMLDCLNKKIRLEEIQRAFRLSAGSGIERTAYILLGCPGFTERDYLDTWQFFKDIDADNYVLNVNIPYKGTKIYEEMRGMLHDAGLYVDGEEGFMHMSADMQKFWGISDETLERFLNLKRVKEDSFCRKYKTKIIDREQYMKTRTITYVSGME